MLALVEAGEATQVGCRVGVGDGAFAISRDGWGVVASSGEGAFAHVEVLANDVLVSEDASLFEVAIGDFAGEVLVGNHFPLNVQWKRGPPDNRWMFRSENDTAHAWFGRIAGPNNHGFIRKDLRQTCWPVDQTMSKGFKVVEVVAKVRGDADAMLVGMLEP